MAPRPSTDALRAYYKEDYYSGGTGQAYNDYFREAGARIAGFKHRLRRLTRHVAAGRLLDVGCAAGFFLKAAESSFEVHGVELSAAAAQYGREQFGLDIHTGTVADAPFAAQSFDVVTMWDTIEHLNDPLTTVRDIHRVLRPGGLLVLSTADVASFTARLYGRHWILYAPPWHLFYFSEATLRKLLAAAGFDVVKVTRGGVPLLNQNTPTGLAWLPAKLLGNRYAAPVLERLGVGFILTVYARRRVS